MGPKIRELITMTKDATTRAAYEEILKEETRHEAYATALLGLCEGVLNKNKDRM